MESNEKRIFMFFTTYNFCKIINLFVLVLLNLKVDLRLGIDMSQSVNFYKCVQQKQLLSLFRFEYFCPCYSIRGVISFARFLTGMYGIAKKRPLFFLSTLISILLPPEKLQMQLSRQHQSNLRFSSRRYTYARRNYPFLYYIILIYNPLTTMLPIIASLSMVVGAREREREWRWISRKIDVAADLHYGGACTWRILLWSPVTEMSARYGGAETSVKTTVKRSNYAIARHLQHCILYHTCERAAPPFRKQVRAMRRWRVRFTYWSVKSVKDSSRRDISRFFFSFLGQRSTINWSESCWLDWSTGRLVKIRTPRTRS